MNDFDPKQKLNEEAVLEIARNRLQNSVADPELRGYAYGEGPLTAMELSDEQIYAVMRVASKYGWPDGDDVVVLSTRNYSDASFRENLFSHRSEDKPDALNNFHLFILARPIDAFDPDTHKLPEIYGMEPVVHRANALAPQFFGDLRTALESFGGDTEYARERLADNENAAVLEGMNLGYKIMGRLVSRRDTETETTDAHQTLTT